MKAPELEISFWFPFFRGLCEHSCLRVDGHYCNTTRRMQQLNCNVSLVLNNNSNIVLLFQSCQQEMVSTKITGLVKF